MKRLYGKYYGFGIMVAYLKFVNSNPATGRSCHVRSIPIIREKYRLQGHAMQMCAFGPESFWSLLWTWLCLIGELDDTCWRVAHLDNAKASPLWS